MLYKFQFFNGKYYTNIEIVECESGRIAQKWSSAGRICGCKASKMIIENNKRDLQYYSHLFSQHCCNYKQEWLKTKKSKNAQPRLELAPFERPIVV